MSVPIFYEFTVKMISFFGETAKLAPKDINQPYDSQKMQCNFIRNRFR